MHNNNNNNKKLIQKRPSCVLIIIYTAIIVNPEISSGSVHMHETRLPIKRKFQEINIDYSERGLL